VGKSEWGFLFLSNVIYEDKEFRLPMHLAHCQNNNIGFGVINKDKAFGDASWKEKDCIEYVGINHYVFEGGKQIISGSGRIWQGMNITMAVNLQKGSIEWISERGI
jgi:hypothetical protein